MRTTRYLGARTVTKDDATVLTIMPLFPGESVAGMQIDAYAVALSDEDVSNPLEMNWYGLGLPWTHVLTTTALSLGTLGAQLTTVALWDSLYEQYLLDTSQDGTEYYGGDVDVDPEITLEEEGHIASDEELIDSGPTGPYRWFRREILSRTHVAAGNATVRGGDEFRASPGRQVRTLKQAQILLFGMVRHEIDAETNFNLELDDATAIEAMGLLTLGDYDKVKGFIRSNSGAVGDFIRTVLYGGDSYIEASTMKGTSVKAYCKIKLDVTGPLDRSAA